MPLKLLSDGIPCRYLWGRGSLDVKACVTALLEAVTRLLKAGYTPARTIMISFGHDEEVGMMRVLPPWHIS
jgi:carboxypeptidase PM20D1